jgi:hypothetical protein
MNYLSASFGLVFWQIMVFSFWLFMIFAIIDIVRSKYKGNNKLIWVLVTIFVPCGGLIYFIFGRKNKVME